MYFHEKYKTLISCTYMYIHTWKSGSNNIHASLFSCENRAKNSNEKLFAQKACKCVCIFAGSIFRLVYVILLSTCILIVSFTCFNFSSNVYTYTFNIPLVGLTVVLLRGYVKHHCVIGDLAVTCRRQSICY